MGWVLELQVLAGGGSPPSTRFFFAPGSRRGFFSGAAVIGLAVLLLAVLVMGVCAFLIIRGEERDGP